MKRIADPGGHVAAPPDGMSWEEWIGTETWAQRVRLELQSHVKRLDYEPRQVTDYLRLFAKHRAWSMLTRKNGQPYESFQAFCEDRQPWGLGITFKILRPLWESAVGREGVLVEAPVLHEHGTNQHAEREDLRAEGPKYGETTDYLLARLKRDAPEVAEAWARGEFPSVRQAAIAAGVVRPPSAVQTAVRAVRKIESEEELRAVADAVATRLIEVAR